MASPYIGVYKAAYDYAAATDEELSLAAGDLLYLLQKSDIDDWWTVKKRLLPPAGGDVEEPTGLVPANYIEPAPTVGRCVVLYDYAKQTDEELSFSEGDAFELYDVADPDWFLAGAGGMYGFIPLNYVRMDQGVPAAAAMQPVVNSGSEPQTGNTNSAPAARPITEFAPPPVHKDRLAQQQQALPPPSTEELDVEGHSDSEPQNLTRPARPQQHDSGFRNDLGGSDDEAPPPPMPTRPGSLSVLAPASSGDPRVPSQALPETPQGSHETDIGANSSPSEQHGFDGEFFRWYIDEVDGRKKRPIVLAIGNGLIIIKPKTSNPKKLKLKSASSLDNNWRIRDLTNFNHEKKHVFLDLCNPDASIELHAGSKDVAEAIVSVLGDLKGAEAATGLKEVARAALTKPSANNRRIGRLLYTFKAKSKDELLCRENDEVYVVDLNKSKEWWLCERVADGRQGVIPSSYIEIVATTNLDKLTDDVERRKSQKTSTASSKGKVIGAKSRLQRQLYRTRDDRDKIRESDRKRRDKDDSAEGENMPNFHRVRTWIDSSGTFKVEAEFLGCVEGKVHLHKTNGVKIAVSAAKLSIEDLEYVEKVTGASLQKYKDEVNKQLAKKEKSKAAPSNSKASSSEATPPPVASQATSSKASAKSATAVINDVPPEKPSRTKASSSIPQSEPEYDWFDFFLTCGVDIGNCQRYSINFSKEQMDESVLEDITPSLLRSLGLREGDILRVMKYLNTKFDRKKTTADETTTQGSLFTEPTGALKNNSTTELSKVNASALPTPSPMKEHRPVGTTNNSQNKVEDDAWAIKPAAHSSTDAFKTVPRAQYTGSLQDLVDVKPLEANKTGLSAVTSPATMMTAAPSAPAMSPVKTSNLNQQNQEFSAQRTGSNNPAPLPMNATRTGGLIPVPTGGLIPVQPTGFIPILSQPTGFIPIQATGGLVSQPTFGFVPLQTGNTTFVPQRTGQSLAPVSSSSFGQIPSQVTNSFVPLQPGNLTQPQGIPLTTFGQQPTGGQYFTGSTGFGSQATGQTFQNAFVPQSTFGRQITGGFMGANQTGGAQVAPPTSFGNQMTGGMAPQTSFGNQMTGGMAPQTSFGNQMTGGMAPQTSFGNQMTGGMAPQTSFGNQMTGGTAPQTSFGNQVTGGYNMSIPQLNQQQTNGVNQVTNMFQNTSLGGQSGPQFNQQSMYPQQPTYGPQPTNSFVQGPTTSFGQQPMTAFGQQPTNSFAQQPFGQQTFGQQPTTSFGQHTFEGFNNQPLQSQPTGLGFGNAPNLQSQPTGRRANLQAATADNPFGF